MKILLEEWMKTQDFSSGGFKHGRNERHDKANAIRMANAAKRHKAIKDMIAAHPTMSPRELAEKLGCSRSLIYLVRKTNGTTV